MNALTLSHANRAMLAEQAVSNGTFLHQLRDAQGNARVIATIAIEQCDQAISVRLEMADTRNQITISRRDDAGERIACFVEDVANGKTPSAVPELHEAELIDCQEVMLREAIRLGRGTYYLAIEGELDLCLLVRAGASGRPEFCFEMHEQPLMRWIPLLADRQLAYEQLCLYVRELTSNYSNVSAN